MIVPGICDISDWEERVVFVRASVNVPLTKDGEIADDFRIQRLLPTVHYLVEQEAKVVIIGHIGRDRQATLEPVRDRLAEDIELDYMPDFFARDIDTSLGELDEWIAGAAGGSVVLLDNVRSTPKEQANDETLAQVVAQRGDVYVNEAFAASHRMHMSLDALPRSISQAVAGFTCLEEIEALQLATSPRSGSVAIIAGNKAITKLPLIKTLLDSYQAVYVGGALANTLYHLAGQEIGRSVYEDNLDESTRTLGLELLEDSRVRLPTWVVCEDSTGAVQTKERAAVNADDAIYDVATRDIQAFIDEYKESPLAVWNGPLGYLEEGYVEATYALALLLQSRETESIVGGGNTVDALRAGGYDARMDFCSTGGGAMIQFLTHRSLVALEALHHKRG